MLPLPRRRVDPEELRERLRALASGEPRSPRVGGFAALGLAPGVEDAGGTADDAGAGPRGGVPTGEHRSGTTARGSLRAVVVAVTATALAAWLVVRLTAGGVPSAVELAPGPPLVGASASPAVTSTGPTELASASTVPSAGGAQSVVVQVIGEVRRPGLVTLPLGARVADAVAAAGGLVRGGSSGGLNLARVLVDGEQVVVSPDATPDAAAPAAGPGAPSVVNLNSATVADLDTLPGVGPVMAARILDWRAAHGRFTSVDQLREVSGVGARTFERLKPHVRV